MVRNSSLATAIRQADRGYRAARWAAEVFHVPAMGVKAAAAAVKPAAAKANGTPWLSSDPWVVSLM